MSGHAELDPGHADELAETIDSLPLSAEQSAVLGLSAMSTVHGLARVLDDLVDTGTPRPADGRQPARLASVDRPDETLHPLEEELGLLDVRKVARLLEDRPLGTGNAFVDLPDDQWSRLVVATRTRAASASDLTHRSVMSHPLNGPITWNSLGPFIVWYTVGSVAI